MPAALNPVFGTAKVQRLILGLARKLAARSVPELIPVAINGRAGFVVAADGIIHSALDIETDGDRITAFFLVRNPEKLARLAGTITRASSRGSFASD